MVGDSEPRYPVPPTWIAPISPGSPRYPVYYIEDLCAPSVSEISGLHNGDSGDSDEIDIAVRAIGRDCEGGVPDGTAVRLQVDDLEGTGTILVQSSVIPYPNISGPPPGAA
jgi:hypothetical protein